MIDYLRPTATGMAEAAAPPYEVLFQRGDSKNQLWYMNGSDKPHCAAYRPIDSMNGDALMTALEVVLGGLPEDVTKINVRPKSDECREALKKECKGIQTKVVMDRLVTPPVARTVTFHI